MPNETLRELVAISDRLLDPGGCPWDREQTPETLKPFVLEEACEVIEAIDSGDPEHLREELGDLLFQVVFLANLGKRGWRDGRFDMDDVVKGIGEKLIHRHPHVFRPEEVRVTGSNEVLRNWERIKLEEKKAQRESVLDGAPAALPALARAQRLSEKAARVGFDWEGPGPVIEKLDEELEEFHRELEAPQPNRDRLEDELGDVLFVLVNLARHLKLDAEGALRRANRKFTTRFQKVERWARDSGRAIADLPMSELDGLWSRAKAQE